MYVELELRHLELVRAVAEEGSLARAAVRRGVTPSALSHQLRDAEDRLGVRLFDRVGRRLRLTAAGERLLRSARCVLEELGRACEELQRDAARPRQLIRMTTECNTVYHWLPSRLRLFRRTHPDAELELAPGVSSDPFPALRRGELDLAIVYSVVRDARLRLRPLFRDELVVVVPPGHRLSRSSFVAAEDFARERLLVYSTPREENLVFRELLIPAGIAPARVTHIQLTEAIVELVKGGLGVSVLPRWTVAPQLERGELVARRLTRAGMYRAWSAAWRASDAPDHVIEFVELLSRHPLPLGMNARERRRIALATGEALGR